MDAAKLAASTTRSEQPLIDDSHKGHIFKENITETYKGVPKSLESEALQRKFKYGS